jgi:hypothetical protein
LLIDCAADRADAIAGAAEVEVIGAIVPPLRHADAEDALPVGTLHPANRAIAALAGLKARKILATLGRLPENLGRNLEHPEISPFEFLRRFSAFFRVIY